jgi:Protein of unknown function (DUF4238)
MANTRPKDHHFIPEMHLKHFADAQGMVWTYHKGNGKITPTAPRETGVWRNFYAVEREPGLYFDDLEGCLSAVESDATPIYEKLLLGEIPRGRDRGIFAWFVGTMYARTPGMIGMCAEAKGSRLGMQIAMLTTSREKFNEVMDEAEEEELGPFDPQIRDRVFELLNDPRKYTINVDRSAGLEALGIANDMAEIFCRMGWCLLSGRPSVPLREQARRRFTAFPRPMLGTGGPSVRPISGVEVRSAGKASAISSHPGTSPAPAHPKPKGR